MTTGLPPALAEDKHSWLLVQGEECLLPEPYQLPHTLTHNLLLTFTPAFSARARGRASSDSANFLIAYCSRPGHVWREEGRVQFDNGSWVPQHCLHTSPNEVNCLAISISVAPAPGTKRLSFVSALNVLMPSSTARSTSSIMLSVEPLTTTVEIRLPSWSV